MNHALHFTGFFMSANLPPHLRRLESEAIHIMREVVAEFSAPVMLYSIGKDSSAMLHVALKALDRKSTRLNSSHVLRSRMPSSA